MSTWVLIYKANAKRFENQAMACGDENARLRAALEKIEFSRGTDAGSVNANNYSIARDALEGKDG